MEGMSFISTLLVLFGTPAEPLPYGQAYRATLENGQPLVVYIGADWCPACRTLKATLRTIDLDGFNYGYVDSDADKRLPREKRLVPRLTNKRLIPQLIGFKKCREGWVKMELEGMRTKAEIEAFLIRLQSCEVKSIQSGLF